LALLGFKERKTSLFYPWPFKFLSTPFKDAKFTLKWAQLNASEPSYSIRKRGNIVEKN
jgi:hypothetical protein